MNKSEAGRLGYLKTREALVRHQECQQREAKLKWIGKKCKFCGRAIPYDKRENGFCNHSCARRFYWGGRDRTGRKCLDCGVSLKHWQELYCSHKCEKTHRWRIVKDQIGKAQAVLTDHAGKRYLVERDGRRCSICGLPEWRGQSIPIVLDHVNGNSEDRTLGNLRLVCPNCDAQLPTYKGRNIGNGRYYRRKRYAEGKSY